MTDNKKCEYCDKVGVPIIPVRYAIAAAGSGAPRTDAPGVALPEKAAFYTRRLLRAGYVYVYDEARKRWEDYFATADGHFAKLAETNGAPQPVPQKPFNCPDVVHGQLASCITIRDAKRATNVWIGFSDVQWTASVRKKHAEAAYRKQHMRCVSVNAFQSSPDARHCTGIHEIGCTVTEYALDQQGSSVPPWAGMARKTGAGPQSTSWFGWSPFQFNSRKAQTPILIQTAENLSKGKGFVVALGDPVAILQELSCFAQLELQQFMYDNRADKDRQRKLAVSGTIAQLEAAVRNQAELDEIDAAKDVYNRTVSESGMAMILPSYRKSIESLEEVTAAELDRAGDEAWEKYAEKLAGRGKARDEWQKSYDQALQAFTQQTLDLFGQAFVHWMQSESMRAGMRANFDKDHPAHNAAFTAIMTAAVRGTAGLEPCFDLYVKLLSADTAQDADNLIMRALVFNADGVAEAAEGATHIDKRVVPWDNVYGPYKTVAEKMGEGHADEAAKLMYELAGPIAKVLNGVLDGPAKLIIGIMSLHAGKPWAKVAFTGSRKEFRAELLRQVMTASGQNLHPRDVNRAIGKELKRLEIRGEKLEGRRGAKWLVLLDEQRISGMPKEDMERQRAWLEGALTSPEKLEELRLNNWRGVINGEARMGVVSGILQIVCFTKLVEYEENAMAEDKTESRWRLAAGVLAITGTVCEVAGKVIEGLPRFAAAEAAGAAWTILPRMLNLGSRVLGAAGGAIMAAWDVVKAFEAFQKGQVGVGFLFVGSAVLGVAVTIGFMFAWNPLLMVILVASFVLVAWLLEKFKDNKIQTWMEQCIFGEGRHYGTAEEEMNEFKLAVK